MQEILSKPFIGSAAPSAMVKACIRACSMGAIREERFLIHAERCYTLFSEMSAPIPEGILPPPLDCLIGCLKGQEACPAYRGLLPRRRDTEAFTQEETAAFLSDGNIEDVHLRENIGSKFRTLVLTEGLPILRRNLRLLLEIRSRAKNVTAGTLSAHQPGTLAESHKSSSLKPADDQ
jgi:epoxyqueuosine reductase